MVLHCHSEEQGDEESVIRKGGYGFLAMLGMTEGTSRKGGNVAERRMFHTAVVESDAFLDMPAGAQALYFHLGMNADDDGFINGPKQIARRLRRPQKDLALLVEKGFLMDFDGIMVVKHWRVANNWKTDRLQLPRYPEIADKIFTKPDRSYTLTRGRGCKKLLQEKRKAVREHGIRMDSQKRREEKRREEKKIEENRSEEKWGEESAAAVGLPPDLAAEPPTYDDIDIGNCRSVIHMTPRQTNDLVEKIGLDGYAHYVLKLADFIRSRRANVKDQYATILKWWEEDRR